MMKDQKVIIVAIAAIALVVMAVGAASQEKLVKVKVGEAVTLNHLCDLSKGGYIDMGREEKEEDGKVYCHYKWTNISNPPVKPKCKAPENVQVVEATLKNGTGMLTLKFFGGVKIENQGQYRAYCWADPFQLPYFSVWKVTVEEGPANDEVSTGVKMAAIFCVFFCVGAAINVYTIWFKIQSVAEERESGGDLDLEANEMEVTLE